MEHREPALALDNLKVYFPVKKGALKRTVGFIKAVDGVSFSIRKGETFGLVGESGCGKTSIGKAIVRLNPIYSGSVLLKDCDISRLSHRRLQPLRRKVQMIFQDPFSSLNPRMTVGEIIGEPIRFYHSSEKPLAEILRLMDICGLRKEVLNRYPHQFSGGQRQRIGIARALACQPDVIIADEPVSALDVSIQAQIIILLKSLQKELQLSYLFIAHDLSVVKHISHLIGVMYLGRIMEISPAGELYRRPLHPYTKALIASVPIPDPRLRSQKIPLQGEIPSPFNTPPGCKFQNRCPHATDVCRQKIPELETVTGEHRVACHHWRDLNAG